MTRLTFPTSLLALTLLPLSGALAQQPASRPAPGIAAVRQGFLAPPDQAKPMVRWWWFGPAVVKPEILRELQQMKANGVGGAEMAFVYPEVLDDPSKDLKNLPFLSPEMLDDVKYAQIEGRKLGLRIDITLCTGWPYGGPTITLDEAVTRLRTIEVPIPANAGTVTGPTLEEGEHFVSAAIVNPRALPKLPEGPARGRGAVQQPVDWDPASAQFLPTPAGGVNDPISVTPAAAPRIALFFVLSHTKQEVKRASVDAEGWVLDPFSHEAVAKHLKNVGEPLLSAFGSTPPYAIFSDSLEAYGADWTPNLPAEFVKRRGYDLMAHLPELVGGGSLAADTVRHDYGRTLTELIDENYLTQINNWAIAHHTKFRSQTYGEPAVSFSSQVLAGLPEGEGPQWRAFSTLRWATSANHVYGNNVTSGETFTWLHSPVFRATPLDMKAEADIDFIMGENQLVFHGWPYSPPHMADGTPEVPEPGWSLYAAASFNDHNPWWPVEASVNKYIARMSYLLRQGQPANQVAILLPTDDAWASFGPNHTSITGVMNRWITPELMSTILNAGYNIDYIDADAINKVGLGTHQILILPPTTRIPVETMRKIHAFAAHDGKVFALGHLPQTDAEGKRSPEIDHLSEAIAVVPDNASLATAMQSAVVPDFRVAGADDATKSALGFIRRKLPDGDTYFVVNTGNKPVDVTANFATDYKQAVAVDPDSTASTAATIAGQPIHLAPFESRIFFFSSHASEAKPAAEPGTDLADLSSDWKVTFTATGKSEDEAKLTDWTADPDTLHYSGEGLYSRDFTLAAAPHGAVYLQVDGGKPLPMPWRPGEPPVLLPNGLPDPRVTRTGSGMHAYFDPPLHEAALVTVNGKSAGALWHPPYRLDVTSLLKPGANHIEIRVYNTALNAWSALPPHDYKPLIAKYGDRFQMQDLDQVKPVPSGILGSIRLVTEGAQ
jgi:hypothetical protein